MQPSTATQPHFDFAVDVAPLFGLPQAHEQIVKSASSRRSKLEPRQKIEISAYVATVI